MKSFHAILLLIGCISLTFAGPSVIDSKMETVRNVQLIRSILSRMAKEIREALKSKEPNQKIVSILENGNKELTEILPKIKHMFVPRMVSDVISRSQKLIQTMSVFPNSGRNEVKAFIKRGMHDYYFSHLEKMYLRSKKPEFFKTYEN